MKKKNVIIIIYPFSLHKYLFPQYELNELNKNFIIEFHILKNLINPHFAGSNKSNLIKKKNSFEFNSFNSWKNYLLKKKNFYEKKERKIIILNRLHLNTIKSFLVISFIKKLKLPIIEFYRKGDFPQYKYLENNIKYFDNIFRRINNLFDSFKISIFHLKFLTINFIFKKIFFFDFEPDYLFVSGNINYKLSRKEYKSTKLVKYHQQDFSRLLEIKNKKKRIIKKKYALFVSYPIRNEVNDSLFYKTQFHLTSKMYNEMNSFFIFLKKKYNLETVVALHPKHRKNTKLPYLSKLKHYHLKTLQLTKDCDLFISYASTALIPALFFKKPIMFFSTSEMEASYRTRFDTYLIAKILGRKVIRIDENFIDKNIQFKVNKKKYQNFLYNYSTFKKIQNIRNYKIISDFFSKI